MSKVTETALSAYEQALKAAEMEALHEEALKMEQARQSREQHRRNFEGALPILSEWFPGAKWTYHTGGDFDRDTIISEEGADARSPLKLRVHHFMVDMNEPLAGYRTRLEIGRYVRDTSMPGYTYFQGVEVKSPADIGRYLASVST